MSLVVGVDFKENHIVHDSKPIERNELSASVFLGICVFKSLVVVINGRLRFIRYLKTRSSIGQFRLMINKSKLLIDR